MHKLKNNENKRSGLTSLEKTYQLILKLILTIYILNYFHVYSLEIPTKSLYDNNSKAVLVSSPFWTHDNILRLSVTAIDVLECPLWREDGYDLCQMS